MPERRGSATVQWHSRRIRSTRTRPAAAADGRNSFTLRAFVPVPPPRRLHDLSERRRAASLIDGEATEVHDGRKAGNSDCGLLRLRLRHNGARVHTATRESGKVILLSHCCGKTLGRANFSLKACPIYASRPLLPLIQDSCNLLERHFVYKV